MNGWTDSTNPAQRPSYASRIARAALRCGHLAACLELVAIACIASPAWAQNVSLGTAADYSVLAGSAVTNTGPSVVTGSVGVAPGTSITGFPPGIIVPGSGTQHSADAVALQAQSDLTTAYNDAAGRPSCTQIAGGLLGTGGATTLGPGVYCMGAGSLTGTLTLNGAGVYIFQFGSSLTTASASSIALTNGASACGVWWQVTSSATIGTSTAMVGNILALTSITLNTGSNLNGRALARNGAVTLDSNTITACSGGPIPPVLIPTTLNTQASPSLQLGGSIHDTATLGGGLSPTGTITFQLFGPDNVSCTGTPAFTSTVTVAGDGSYDSANFTPSSAGVYRWIASYSGDAANAASATACNDSNESVIISTGPALTPTTLSTQASSSVPLGGLIHDTATLGAGVSPTGAITFHLFGPNNASCTGTPAFTSTVTVAGDGSYNSASFTPLSAGVYRWIASYSGDAANAASTTACGDANESVTVSALASTTLSTQASPSVLLGGSIHDTAILGAGLSPTGTITFQLFGPNNASCTGTPAFTSAVTVNGNGSYNSASFTPSSAGVYRWIASYGGDGANAASATACNDANESATISPAVVPTASPAPMFSEGAIFMLAALLVFASFIAMRRHRR